MRRPRAAAGLLCASAAWGVCAGLYAGERTLKASIENYTDAPVIARSVNATLREESPAAKRDSSAQPARTLTSQTPAGAGNTQALVSTGDTSDESSRFISSAALPSKKSLSSAPVSMASTGVGLQKIVMKGDMKCWNKSPKDVAAVAVLIVPFDENHASLGASRSNLARIDQTVFGGAEAILPWQIAPRSADIAEIALAILSIKFSDGTVWEAPDVETVDFF